MMASVGCFDRHCVFDTPTRSSPILRKIVHDACFARMRIDGLMVNASSPPSRDVGPFIGCNGIHYSCSVRRMDVGGIGVAVKRETKVRRLHLQRQSSTFRAGRLGPSAFRRNMKHPANQHRRPLA